MKIHTAALLLALSPVAAAQSPQPYLIKDVQPGSGGGGALYVTPLGTKAFFLADDGVNGKEPWISDGTAAGTFMLGDLNPAGDTLMTDTIAFGFNRVFFSTVNALWVTDGTSAGTILLKDFVVPGSAPGFLAGAAGELFFAANDGIVGRELWKTDGTGAGTVLVKDVNPGPASSISNSYGRYIGTAIGANLYFAADDGASGEELWISDGTAAGTQLLVDGYPGPLSSRPYFLTTTSGRVWYRGTTNLDTTLIVYETATGQSWQFAGFVSDPGSLIQWGAEVFFSGDDGANGVELMKVHSTTYAVTSLGDLNPGPASSMQTFEKLLTEGSLLYFSADTAAFGEEPWVTDGTPAGTRMLRDLQPGPGSSDPFHFQDVDGMVLFSASPGGDRELWRTDGSGAGTLPFWQINPTGSAQITAILDVGPHTFVPADNGSAGMELHAFWTYLSGQSYCTSGTSELGCFARVTATGIASRLTPTGFDVRTTKAQSQKDGIFFFSTNGRQANPWGSGSSYQCVVPPVTRTPLRNSGGSVNKCNGSHTIDFNAWMAANPTKAPTTGDLVQIQCWYRDPGNTSNQTTSLSNALEFAIYP